MSTSRLYTLTIFSWDFVPFSCSVIVFIVMMTLEFYPRQEREDTHILWQSLMLADQDTPGESAQPQLGHETSE